MWALTLISQIRSQSASVVSMPPGVKMPALEQNRSIGPYVSVARATNCCRSASRRTSVVTAMPPISFATRVAALASTSATTTPRAPSVAKRRQSARPIPLPPPVTTATFSLSFIQSRYYFGHARGFLFPLDLDRHLPAHLPPSGDVADFQQRHPVANKRSGRNRTGESDLVRSIVDGH